MSVSSGADITASNGHGGHHHNSQDDDHILRPRPRKPQHSQLTQLTRLSSDGDSTHLAVTPDAGGGASGMTR
jgi:sterol O-acyltransferase